MLTHYTSNGLGFADGTELSADLIVFATGFDLNMRNDVKTMFGDKVAQYFGDFNAMNEEGEFSGAYRFCRQSLGPPSSPFRFTNPDIPDCS